VSASYQKISALLIISLFVLFAGGCGQNPVQSSYVYKAVPVQNREIEGIISVTGVLNPVESVTVSSQISGHVSQVTVEEGTSVQKGETLISLDKKDLQVQLAQAQSNVEHSQSSLEQAEIAYQNALDDYNRSKELYDSGALARNQLDKSKVQLDLAKKQMEAARKSGMASANSGVQAASLALNKADIKSPINGVVTAKNVNPGENITPGVPLLTIVNTENLLLTGNVSEELINLLNQNLTAKITADAVPGKEFSGKVKFISPISISTGQFFPVEIIISNSDLQLKAGMTASAQISVKQQAARAVPNSAVINRDGKNYVFVIEDDKVHRTPVKIGLSGAEYTSILSGLDMGDMIVTSNPRQLTDGDTISYTRE